MDKKEFINCKLDRLKLHKNFSQILISLQMHMKILVEKKFHLHTLKNNKTIDVTMKKSKYFSNITMITKNEILNKTMSAYNLKLVESGRLGLKKEKLKYWKGRSLFLTLIQEKIFGEIWTIEYFMIIN